MMVGMADLIVVTGPPGAGKTTVAKALSSLFESSALVAGDDFFEFIDRSFVPPWATEAHHQNEIVIEAAAAAAGRLAAGGYTVVYDGVLGPWFLDAFGQAAGLGSLHYVVLLPPEKVCLERVRSRVGHGFTDLEAAGHMYREFSAADIDGRHVVTSTETAAVIASSLVELVSDGTLHSTIDERSG
jgi:adenylate kinase family enzyme